MKKHLTVCLILLLALPGTAFATQPVADCKAGSYFGKVFNDARSDAILTRFWYNGGQLTGEYAIQAGRKIAFGTIDHYVDKGTDSAQFRWRDDHGSGVMHLQFTPNCQGFAGFWGTHQGEMIYPWDGAKAQVGETAAKKLSQALQGRTTARSAVPYEAEEEREDNDDVFGFAPPAPLTTQKSTPSRTYFSTPASKPFNSNQVDTENYAHYQDNPLKRTREAPVSTFSIDVDTGAYSNARRMLNSGQLPRRDAVRVEEFINYFDYDYPTPDSHVIPFSLITQIAPTPWNANSHLLHIGIKGYAVEKADIPASNLVFLLDVSGSMQSANKLPLLKSAFRLLVNQMRAQDKIAIVVYAGAAGLVLESTAGDQKATILAALNKLAAGGSTNGGQGVRLAYSVAQQNFVPGGVNRIILATDGDFNVGTTNFQALKNLVEEQRRSGIALTTLGFGAGNYNDRLMEQLADVGNGQHAYIDNLKEGKKVLVDELSATLQTIAKDVKIQIEFNPAQVSEYRLIGYENRQLQREDFNNDKVDAGDIGAGHTVTALYEITLVGSPGRVEPLRYAQPKSTEKTDSNAELAFLKLRYKAPNSDKSRLIAQPVLRAQVLHQLHQSSQAFRFSAAVAAFAQQLRGGKYLKDFTFDNILQLARHAKGDDPWGYRGELLQLIGLAQALSTAK